MKIIGRSRLESHNNPIAITEIISPMLAQCWNPDAKMQPCIIQPKLDGMRCIAKLENGKCVLKSRAGNLITSSPHIEKQIETQFSDHELLILDGELYIHNVTFETVISQARRDVFGSNEQLEFWIYDCIIAKLKGDSEYQVIPSDMFICRWDYLQKNQHQPFERYPLLGQLRLLESEKCSTVETAKLKMMEYIGRKFEGAILRYELGQYKFGRSSDLLKCKISDTSEHEVIGVIEGIGTMKGCAIFVCKNPNGASFRCKLTGSFLSLKKYWDNPELVIGKQLTVQHQGLTAAKLPRFPVGIAIRDYE